MTNRVPGHNGTLVAVAPPIGPDDVSNTGPLTDFVCGERRNLVIFGYPCQSVTCERERVSSRLSDFKDTESIFHIK